MAWKEISTAPTGGSDGSAGKIYIFEYLATMLPNRLNVLHISNWEISKYSQFYNILKYSKVFLSTKMQVLLWSSTSLLQFLSLTFFSSSENELITKKLAKKMGLGVGKMLYCSYQVLTKYIWVNEVNDVRKCTIPIDPV